MKTIVDVARVAGVSPMTVSRYFNNPGLLRSATRERVRRAVEELDYIPNQAARSLVRGRSKTVSLVLADITNPFYTTLGRGVEDAAHAQGYTLTLGNSDETVSKELQYIRNLLASRVDGVLLCPSAGGDVHVDMLLDRSVPLVLVDRSVPGKAVDVVRGDTYAGARMLVRHLAERGYRRIAFVGGEAGVSSLEDRLRGYRVEIQTSGLEADVRLGKFLRTSGENIVDAMAREGSLPEAIIAANNLVAVGIIVALRRHGLRVPEDVALACVDDIETAAAIDPFLTVVAQPAYEIGRTAMDLLLERMDGYDGPPRDICMPVALYVRRSSMADLSTS